MTRDCKISIAHGLAFLTLLPAGLWSLWNEPHLAIALLMVWLMIGGFILHAKKSTP